MREESQQSLGTILKGTHSHNIYFASFLQYDLHLFFILITSTPVQMINEAIFIIAMETDSIQFQCEVLKKCTSEPLS